VQAEQRNAALLGARPSAHTDAGDAFANSGNGGRK